MESDNYSNLINAKDIIKKTKTHLMKYIQLITLNVI